MRVLAIADIHAEEIVLERLKEARPDALFIAGDITTKGPTSFAEDIAHLPYPVYAVSGNMDTVEVRAVLSRAGVLLDGQRKKIGEWSIVGCGGSNTTPHSTPHEKTEEELAQEFKKNTIDEKTILLTHAPPYGFFDEVNSRHVGSHAIHDAIIRGNPYLVLCGHIHEHEGERTLQNGTKIVKLGPAFKGRAAEIDLKTREVRFFNLY